jgi:hypothetical protein
MSAETKTATFPVESFRRLPDPVAVEERERYFALCDVERLPLDLPTDTNPRQQNLQTKVAKAIRAGLLGESGPIFHLLNRGLLISAETVTYDNKTSRVTIHMPNGERHGVVDGGHTYRIIKENLDALTMQQFVQLEIMTGIEDDFADIAGARNTSVQVQEKSLANLNHELDIVKRLVAHEPFASDIAYEQFAQEEIDVLDVIAILTMFNIDVVGGADEHPIYCYAWKGRALQVYLSSPERRETYAKLGQLVSNIFRLHDHVHRTFRDMYNDATGGRAGGRKEIRTSERARYPLKFSPRTLAGEFQCIKYEIPSGFVYPILGAMRFLVEPNAGGSEFVWKVSDPIAFYDQYVGPDLVRNTMEASMDLGQNPNAVGKSRRHWDGLYTKVAQRYLETQAR